jgi:hypothetical protein
MLSWEGWLAPALTLGTIRQYSHTERGKLRGPQWGSPTGVEDTLPNLKIYVT